MTKFFKKTKNPAFLAPFLSIFPFLGAKYFFLENEALLGTVSYGFLAPRQNLEKRNYRIPRKRLDRSTEEG